MQHGCTFVKDGTTYIHFGRMVSKIRKRCKQHPFYLRKGIQCHLTYEMLYDLWERDNAEKMDRPSIDRIDPDGHYTFENCRFLELKENIARGRKLLLPPNCSVCDTPRFKGRPYCQTHYIQWKREVRRIKSKNPLVAQNTLVFESAENLPNP